MSSGRNSLKGGPDIEAEDFEKSKEYTEDPLGESRDDFLSRKKGDDGFFGKVKGRVKKTVSLASNTFTKHSDSTSLASSVVSTPAYNINLDVDAEDLPPEIVVDLGNLDITTMDVGSLDENIQDNLLEDEVVKRALKEGQDLRVVASTLEKDLNQIERDAILDYIKEAENIALLHGQLQSCDAILQHMEGILSTFQSDLGTISSEIFTLQKQSVSMNAKLTNRKTIQSKINTFVSSMTVTQEFIDVVLNAPVASDQFEDALAELDMKILNATSHHVQLASRDDIMPTLERLKAKSVAKIREYVLTKIGGARKPMANLQIIQNTLLKSERTYTFLSRHSPEVAKEILTDYVDTMSKVHMSYFKAYFARLAKLQFDEPDKDDLLGADDSSKRGGLFGTVKSLKNRSTVFTIGQRASILKELEAPIIVPLAPKDGAKEAKVPYEVVFRSIQYAVVDISSREYLFAVQFFDAADPAQAHALFYAVMEKTLTFLTKSVEMYSLNCYDGFSLVLCARITAHYKHLLKERAIPILDAYFEQLETFFWPRFTTLTTLNVESVGKVDPRHFAVKDTMPHFIVRRYAEYSGALTALNETLHAEPLIMALTELRDEVTNFVLKMASEFQSRKDQLIFLINNYDLMLGVYNQQTTLVTHDTEALSAQLKKHIGDFVVEELSPSFGGLISFAKEAERALQTTENKDSVRVDEKRVGDIINGFQNDWKKNIDRIAADVTMSFPNFKVGGTVLEAVFTQLITSYDQFLNVLKQKPYKRPQWSLNITSHHLMVELKKYRPNF